MTEKDVFLAICGIDEDGDGRAVSMIETLYAATDPFREDRTVDSITFDGHPENIFNHIEHCFRLLGDKTTGVLNANDPISCELDKDGRRVSPIKPS